MSALTLTPLCGVAAGLIAAALALPGPAAAQSPAWPAAEAEPPSAAASAPAPAPNVPDVPTPAEPAGPAPRPAAPATDGPVPEAPPDASPDAPAPPASPAEPDAADLPPRPALVEPFDLDAFPALERVARLEPFPALPGEPQGPGLLLRAPAEWERRPLAERTKLPVITPAGMKLPRSWQVSLQLQPTEAGASLAPVPLAADAARPELRFRAAWMPVRDFAVDLVPGVYLDRNGLGAPTTGATVTASVATAWATDFRTVAEVESPRLGSGSRRVKFGAAWQPWQRVSIDTRFEQSVGANAAPDPTVRFGLTIQH